MNWAVLGAKASDERNAMRVKLNLHASWRLGFSGLRCGFLLGVLANSSSLSAQLPDPDRIVGLLACEVARPLVLSLPREPVYTLDAAGTCVQTGTLGGTRFSDAQCERPIATDTVTFDEYCESVTVPSVLGDASALPQSDPTWYSTPGTRLPLTLPGLSGSAEPYVGRLNYRSVVRDGATCALEMRVYSAQPGALNQPAVIAFHGGSWSSRRSGFPGMETLISQFTDRGMVVFAPFYRLAGDEDGPATCRNWLAEDIVADAEAALDWVAENGAQYGAAAGNPVVFGQSAGAFLAAWLAVERESAVAAALLMYPPTDVGDFATQALSGRYQNPDGVRILERFLGESSSLWSPSSARLARFSLATRVAGGEPVAPLRVVHGLADDLVPPRQAMLLCAAADSMQAWQVLLAEGMGSEPQQSASSSCGPRGQLDLLAGAKHALEVCLPGVACQAGNVIQALLAREVLIEAHDWLALQAEAARDDTLNTPSPPEFEPPGSEQEPEPEPEPEAEPETEVDTPPVIDAVDDGSEIETPAPNQGGGGLAPLWIALLCLRVSRPLRPAAAR